MDEIYRNIWFDSGCTSAAMQIVAIGLTAVTATIGLIWVIAYGAVTGAARKAGQSGRLAVRSINWLLGLCLVGLCGVVGYASLSGSVLQRAAFGADTIVLDYCDGFSARTERLAKAELTLIDYRLELQYGRGNPTPNDLAILTHRNGNAFEIPLRVEPDVSPPQALIRHLPRAVLEAWDANRRARGASALPPAYLP